MTAIPIVAGVTDFRPPVLAESNPDVVFYLKVPTWEDRDNASIRLYQLGVREVTNQQIQALILSEIYEVKEEAIADADARFLEGFWQRSAAYATELELHQEQEAQRLIDQRDSGVDFEALPPPEQRTTPRERARATILIGDVTDGSERLRAKLADQQMYEKRFGAMLARMQLAGWDGLTTKREATRMPQYGIDLITPQTIEDLRGELMGIDETGVAWRELVSACEHLFDLPRSAEKNLSSPPASTSPPNGSIKTTTGSGETSGGSITSEATASRKRSSTGRRRGRGSPTTTETSSGSTPG